MVTFTSRELGFINAHEICRLATCSKNEGPHVVPVTYASVDGTFYIATDYKTKKLQNIQQDNRVALVIDAYKPNRAILIHGKAAIIERGTEFRRLYTLFHRRFAWVRADPWKENEAPFLKIVALKKSSWGLGD